MGIIELTEETFDAEVLQDKKFVIVDFWASWCTPCRMLAPILEEIADEYPNIKVCKLNVDDAPNIAERYQRIHRTCLERKGAFLPAQIIPIRYAPQLTHTTKRAAA